MSRSSFYLLKGHPPQPSQIDLELVKRSDVPYLKYPFQSSREAATMLQREGKLLEKAKEQASVAQDGDGGSRAEAEYQSVASRAQRLYLRIAGNGNQPAEPDMGHRYNVYSMAQNLMYLVVDIG